MTAAIIRYWLAQNGKGLASAIAIVAGFGLLVFLAETRDASPIVSRRPMSGTILSISPTMGWFHNSRGYYNDYSVQLDDGSTVNLKGPVGAPMLIGQRVQMIQIARENGRTRYILPDALDW